MRIVPLKLTLWTGVVIDAGDDTDVEQAVALAALLAAHTDPKGNPAALSTKDLVYLRDAFLLLTLGTESGAASFTLDSYSLSTDGTNWRLYENLSVLCDSAGRKTPIDLARPWHQDVTHFRLDATVTQLNDPNHKFASSSLELHGSLWIP